MTLKDLRDKINQLPDSFDTPLNASGYMRKLTHDFMRLLDELRKDATGVKEFEHFEGIEDKSAKGIQSFVKKLEERIEDFNSICNACLKPDSKSADWDKLTGLFIDKSGNIKDKSIMTETINRGRDFYRIRQTDQKDPYRIYEHKDMYIIPLELSSKVGIARFNLSGYPCLYLAESLYLAWEECRRPDFHTANFTRFKNRKKLTVLDLTIPEFSKLNSETALFKAYLSLLCSVKVTDKDKDHWQYRIANLFTRFGYQQNKQLDGIKYVSSKRFENKNFRLDYTRECAAYVFLPKDLDASHCKRLASSFEMTKAYSYFYFKFYGINFNPAKKAASRDYDNTVFAFLERQLQLKPTCNCEAVI